MSFFFLHWGVFSKCTPPKGSPSTITLPKQNQKIMWFHSPLWTLLLLCALIWKVPVCTGTGAMAQGWLREWSDQRGAKKHEIAEVRESLGQKLRSWSLHWHVSQGALLAPNTLSFSPSMMWPQILMGYLGQMLQYACFSSVLWGHFHKIRTYDPSPSFSFSPVGSVTLEKNLCQCYQATTKLFMRVSHSKRVQRLPQLGHCSSSHWFCCPSSREATSGKLLMSCCSLWTPLGTGLWSCKVWLDLQSKLSL